MNATLLNIARACLTIGTILMSWALLLILSACSTLPDSSAWYRSDAPPMKDYEWQVKTPQQIEAHCGPTRQGVGSQVLACAVRLYATQHCVIFSVYPEAMARNVPDSSMKFMSVWAHEIEGHCGMNQEGVIWEHP